MGMANKVLKDVIMLGSVGLAMGYAAIHKNQIYGYLGIAIPSTQQTTEAPQSNTYDNKNTMPVIAEKGIMVSIPKSKTDGQFWTQARVDSGMVNFLVDTGAGSVALTPEDARKAGIRLQDLVYNIPIKTAGGDNVAAFVTLKSISVGPVTIRNVRALVVPEGLSTSLLGMSFLGQLQKVEATPYALVLRL